MKRRALLQLALTAGCARAKPKRAQSSSSWLHAGQEYGEHGAEDAAFGERELKRLAGLVRELTSAPERLDVVRAVTRVVFEIVGFVREVHDENLDFVLLPPVLRRGRGNCVGLGTLLIALAEAVDAEAHGVVRPGHFFVRIRDGSRFRNVEPLRAGEEMPDSWYEQRFPVVGGASADYYARALTPEEVLGVIDYNVGNARKKQRRLAEARKAFTRATTHFPDFAEAHASLGSVLHLEGALDAAERSYRRALGKNPGLPGVEWNLEVLAAERAAG